MASNLELVGKRMGMMGSGYGSECHLLRYLGRHRALLDQRVREVTAESGRVAGLSVRAIPTWQDGEWKGLDFLGDDAPAKAAWRSAWPQSG